MMPPCDSADLASFLRMSSASCPDPDADGVCSWTMREEEEEEKLVLLHPRAPVRSLNVKAPNWTGVIWTVSFVEYFVIVGRSKIQTFRVQTPLKSNFSTSCEYVMKPAVERRL